MLVRNIIQRSPQVVIDAIGMDAYQQYSGLMTSPASNFSRESIALAPLWCADNGCFTTAWNETAFQKFLDKHAGIPGCIFINAPDTWGNGVDTLKRFEIWQPLIKARGLPVALTLQAGMLFEDVPFDTLDAIFIGGKDEWQHGETVRQIVAEARRQGKWVHMGRVNTNRRIKYGRSIGCNSFDGTGYKWTVNIIEHMKHLTHYTKDMF